MTKDSKPLGRPQASPDQRRHDRGTVKPWHGVLGNWSVAKDQGPPKQRKADPTSRG